MVERICKDCRWWKRAGGEYGQGECHRYPPTPVVLTLNHGADTDGQNWYPFTIGDDFCGEWNCRDLPHVGECGP